MNISKERILSEAVKHVPRLGFTYTTFKEALQVLHPDVAPGTLLNMWPRGFPVALAEFITFKSTLDTQNQLESRYSKSAMIDLIDRNQTAFIKGALHLPSASDVAEDALLTKVQLLTPYASKWHEAVNSELTLSNLPYGIINLAQFADVTAYYMERVESMNEILDPARKVLQFKRKSQSSAEGEHDLQIKEFLESFLRGIPLSSGPQIGGLVGQVGWSFRRAKLGTVYCASMASLMGDTSSHYSDTRLLVSSMAKTLF